MLIAALLVWPLGAWAMEPGTVFSDCADCPEMVVVPAGSFVMGRADGKPEEGPPHTVTIARPFAVATYETTFDQWQACRAAGACDRDPDDHGWGRGKMPVINIDFDDVRQFTDWLSRTSGATYRLPSEAEWEYAARAGTESQYWWGDEIGANRANCRDCGSEWSGKGSAPTGSFSPNPWGLFDTSGNVWEWVADCWAPSHAGAPEDGSARLNQPCAERVIRGGSWYYFPRLARPTYRARNPGAVFSYNIGFRVVRDLP